MRRDAQYSNASDQLKNKPFMCWIFLFISYISTYTYCLNNKLLSAWWLNLETHKHTLELSSNKFLFDIYRFICA